MTTENTIEPLARKSPPAPEDSGLSVPEGAVPVATAAAREGLPHVSRPQAYDAIVLAGFGGPEGQDDVLPFLRNVTSGRGIPDERLEEVATHYRHYGGISPINGQNRALQHALQAALHEAGIDLPVYWGNRNWAPYLVDALRQAHADGHRRLLTIATSAYSSYSSCRQYREDIADALADAGLVEDLTVDKVRPFFDHPGFVQPFIDGVRDGVAELRRQGATSVHVLFATHSIPTSDAERSGPSDLGLEQGAYPAQHAAVAEVVMAAAAPQAPWQLVYQSRSGPPSQPWLEPDVNDAIAELPATGADAVLIVPLGFLSDHMEVLWDLDNEALQTAAEHGLRAHRAPTPGVDPAFIDGLIDLIDERLSGRPPEQRQAMTPLGPWFDVCRPGCCANVRRGFRPAAAGVAP